MYKFKKCVQFDLETIGKEPFHGMCHSKFPFMYLFILFTIKCCVFPGVFAAAHDLKTEWVVVKGIKDYADGSHSNDEWGTFASVMAASVVANILSDAVIFEDWPHYNPGNASSAIPSLSLLHVHLNKQTLSFLFNILSS